MAMVGRTGWPEADQRVFNGGAALDDGSFAGVGDEILCGSYDGQIYSIPADIR